MVLDQEEDKSSGSKDKEEKKTNEKSGGGGGGELPPGSGIKQKLKIVDILELPPVKDSWPTSGTNTYVFSTDQNMIIHNASSGVSLFFNDLSSQGVNVEPTSFLEQSNSDLI